MRCILIAVAFVVAALIGPLPATHAARDPAPTLPKSDIELLVFERADCFYCEAFRSTIAARYIDTPTAQRAPMRYIDIDRADTAKIGLAGAIGMIPTVVIMKDGREVDRIVGLFGVDNFMSMVTYALQRFE